MSDQGIAAAEEAFSAGDLETAETLAKRLLEDSTHCAAAFHLIGAIELRRKKPKQAIEWMERALANGLETTVVLSNCGEAYRQLGQLEEAYARFERALKLDNTNPHPHFNMGLVMRTWGHAREAEHFFRTSLDLNPGMSRAHHELAELYRQEGHWTEAEREYLDAITLAKTGGDGGATRASILLWSVRLASLLRERGDPLRSVDILNDVLLVEDLASAHYELARSQFELCWERAAEAHYLHATQLQPALGLHNPVRVASAKMDLIKDWCQAGNGHYVSLARSHPLILPPLKVNPSSAASSFMAGAAITPELGCASIEDAEILPRDFAVLAKGRLFAGAVVNWFQHYPQRGQFVRQDTDDARLLLDLPSQVRKHDGGCVLLGGGGDYYAWLYEGLARLWTIEQMPSLANLPLVVPASVPKERLAMLQHFGAAGRRVLRLEEGCTLLARELHVPSLPILGDWVSPLALQFLRRRLGGGPSKAARRIYLSRQGLTDRRLSNEPAVVGLLDLHGFEVIRVGDTSPMELIDILRQARIVVGVDDESIANLVVSPQGTHVGLIATAGAYRPRAHFICGQLAQDLTYLVGETVFESNPVHTLCDIRLHEDVLLAFLQEVEKASPRI